MTRRSSATEWSTAVRWASGSSVVSVAIRSVTAIVVSRVVPPAPYVIDTNDGRSGSSSRIACHSSRSPSAVLGGKNSNEKVGPDDRTRSPIDAFAPGITEGSPRATVGLYRAGAAPDAVVPTREATVGGEKRHTPGVPMGAAGVGKDGQTGVATGRRRRMEVDMTPSRHDRAPSGRPESIGALLARVRLASGRSQLRVAELLCAASGIPTVTRHEISRWEREERIPSGHWLRWLAAVLDVPLAELERAAAVARANAPPDAVPPAGWRPPAPTGIGWLRRM